MMEGSIIFAGLMPHAPILVPGVGRERLAEARSTAGAMATVAQRAVNAHPETIVVVSPHSPRRSGAFGLWRVPAVRGSLRNFGSPADRVDLPVDTAFVDRIEQEAARRGLHTWDITREPLDHGALVPLCYLKAARWKGPVAILGLNYPGEGGLDELGEAIMASARAMRRRIAIIASGDMSHRLAETAPGGYHPDARLFDETFIRLLRTGAVRKLREIDPRLQDDAGEDAVDSTVVAAAAAGYRTDGHRVLSYEGPFGVGYGVAILFDPAPAAAAGPEVLSRYEDLPRIARAAVTRRLAGVKGDVGFQATGILAEPRAVFVTVRTSQGDLRGCRGRLAPNERDLVRETWQTALDTAFRDYRFAPLEAAELPDVNFSVTVLGELEPVASPDVLDPAVFGVVVTAVDGRKGVLLPDIAGVDSVKQQLAIARHKAGIGTDEWVKIQRFRAHSYRETPPAVEAP